MNSPATAVAVAPASYHPAPGATQRTAEERHLERLRGYLEQRPRLGPETVHLDVTNGCNLSCVTCWSYAPTLAHPKPAAWKRERIEPALFLRVLDELVACEVDRVVVSGAGDPFTHPDIERLLGAVKARGLKLTLLTNGTRCDFARLRELGVDQLLLNLASATARTYVAYHPGETPTTFERLVAGCRALRGVTQVNHVQVINQVNAHELVEMVDLAAQVGARCSFKVGDTPAGTERYALGDEQRRQVLDELVPEARRRAKALGVKHNLDAFEAHLRALTRTTRDESVPSPALRQAGQRDHALTRTTRDESVPSPLGERVRVRGLSSLSADKLDLKGEPRAEPSAPPCFAGYLYSRVSLDGRVSFCCAPIEAGDLSRGTFSQVWRSEPYAALRARLHRGEDFEACARCGKHDMNFAAARELGELQVEGAL